MSETTQPSALAEAVDECTRELSLRKRCYPRWIEEGRISRTDARDRVARLETAVRELTKLQDLQEVSVTSSGDKTEQPQF